MRTLLAASLVFLAAPAVAQTTSEITFYELPAYLGRSVTVTAATPELSQQSVVRRAQSARVAGSWTVCTEARYRGICRELTRDTAALRLASGAGAILSLRPTDSVDTAGTAGSGQEVDLEALDVDPGVEGQDVAFFARPSFDGIQVAAGSNDRASANAFCEAAGFTASINAGRARVRAANLIDPVTATRIRSFPLRDVLCRR